MEIGIIVFVVVILLILLFGKDEDNTTTNEEYYDLDKGVVFKSRGSRLGDITAPYILTIKKDTVHWKKNHGHPSLWTRTSTITLPIKDITNIEVVHKFSGSQITINSYGNDIIWCGYFSKADVIEVERLLLQLMLKKQ